MGSGKTRNISQMPSGNNWRNYDTMLKTKRVISLIALGCLILGCVIVAFGFFYDVTFAGIPYQDPPPELLAQYNFHARAAGYFYTGGSWMMVFGIILFVIRLILNRFKPTAA